MESTVASLHTNHMSDASLGELDGVTRFLDSKVDENPRAVISLLTQKVSETLGDPPLFSSRTEAAILMNAAGVVINAASRDADEEALRSAEDWMSRVVSSGILTGTQYESAALYNLANSQMEIADLRILREAAVPSDNPDASPTHARLETRFANHQRLRSARSNFRASALTTTDDLERSTRWCNLANTLDQSGRWIEAYDAYVRALRAAPHNGNAAGNAAVMVSRVIRAGWDYEGHLCSLYDKYLRQAKENRSVTVDVAGEAAAQKYDAMSLTGSDVPITSSPEEADPYRQWIMKNRLALAATLEGLGYSEFKDRWDTIGLNCATTGPEAMSPPPVFAMLNVLKSDFLVARKLAFEAIQIQSADDGHLQHRSDPGLYTDTLDGGLYGQASSQLTLAHRAAMDVLDKTAVAVNEHLQVGDNPKRIFFSRFWFEDKKRTQLRSSLANQARLASSVLAMAELALDMEPGGLYEHAQEMRNAGTHRFVKIYRGPADQANTPSIQVITLQAMQATCLEALTVARAAYIYLTEMLRIFEDTKAKSRNRMELVLPNVR